MTLRREQRELFLLHLASLAGVLLVMALVVRGISREGEWASLRKELEIVAAELSGLPLPAPPGGTSALAIDRGFRQAHQQVEWFSSRGGAPLLRLGEPIPLPPLQPPYAQGSAQWQRDGFRTLALVRPLGKATSPEGERRPAWLRVSTPLGPLHERLERLDLALAAAVGLALLLSTALAMRLTRRALRPLEQNLERLRQFSFDASHELRGPLAALAANIDMALLEAPPTADGSRRRFEAMASATEQMVHLLDDLLLVARHDGQTIQQPRRVDLSELLEGQLALQADGFCAAGLSLEAEIEPGLLVLGQPALLERIFRNLLDNARRYTPRGGTVRLQANRRGGQVRVAVQDTGIGLTPKERERVFDRLWQARPERSGEGSGLGLAIAEQLCTAHGGRIEVDSEVGQGSRFTVTLPLSPGSG
ncbi:MAG: HAMP domain-containing sensor histidine kinase [Synechococcus sp.]|nr:HAMP domain-containing sensor histidine kinase [Synechococcus sp.]